MEWDDGGRGGAQQRSSYQQQRKRARDPPPHLQQTSSTPTTHTQGRYEGEPRVKRQHTASHAPSHPRAPPLPSPPQSNAPTPWDDEGAQVDIYADETAIQQT